MISAILQWLAADALYPRWAMLIMFAISWIFILGGAVLLWLAFENARFSSSFDIYNDQPYERVGSPGNYRVRRCRICGESRPHRWHSEDMCGLCQITIPSHPHE